MTEIEQTLMSQKLYFCSKQLFCRKHYSCFKRETSALYFILFSGFYYFPNFIKNKVFKTLLIHFICLHRHFIYFHSSNLKRKARPPVPWTGDLHFSPGSLKSHVIPTLRDPKHRNRNLKKKNHNPLISISRKKSACSHYVNTEVIHKCSLYLQLSNQALMLL